jgi:hypothetical protein
VTRTNRERITFFGVPRKASAIVHEGKKCQPKQEGSART